MNEQLAASIASLFGGLQASDCKVSCYLSEGGPAKKRRLNDDGSSTQNGRPQPEDTQMVGDALPCHRLVLQLSSKRFAAQLSGSLWHGDQAAGASAVEGQQPSYQQGRTDRPGVPELRVSVSSEAEVSFVHAAIRYAYTGQIQAATVREALEILSKGDYLDVKGCAAACLKLVNGMLSPSPAVASSGQQAATAAGSSGSSGRSSSAVEAALELYACHPLWPSAQEGLDFAATLATAKTVLIGHFGDALATLNTSHLRQQLLALPAEAMEALLESDDFGTDSESSILHLLATWMAANRDGTDSAAVERMCKLVRLAQLSPPYVHFILPALARDHEAGTGWFPVKPMQAAFVASVAGLSGKERSWLEQGQTTGPLLKDQVWYSSKPRRQCVPSGGLQFHWHIDQQDLQHVAKLETGAVGIVDSVFSTGAKVVAVAGLEYLLDLRHTAGVQTAGLFVTSVLPEAFKGEGSCLASDVGVPALVSLNASITVDSWEGGGRKESFRGRCRTEQLTVLGGGIGWDAVLPLQHPDPPAEGGAVPANPVAAYARYLHDGKITGTLTLLR